jgi:mono/diheme cytochrome c family protein
MSFSWRGFIGIVLVCLLAGSSLLAVQTRGAQSVRDGVYTDDQAKRGQTTYNARCANCHGNNLAGRVGPSLAGDDFVAGWSSRPLLELADKVRRTMPKDDSERLTPQQTADVLAYMLQAGKFPAGRTELAGDDAALKQVNFPASAQAKPAAGPAQVTAFPPAGSVAAVMRGILFPSANIIFTTQSIDPGEKKAPTETTGGFDWLIWGGNVYKGWEVVDYAAVSLAESANLMLTPGRKCENGKPVPVSDPDWIKFTNELAEAGRAAYKASQTRNQEIIADNTNQLNDSCMHCHGVFRGRTHCAR